MIYAEVYLMELDNDCTPVPASKTSIEFISAPHVNQKIRMRFPGQKRTHLYQVNEVVSIVTTETSPAREFLKVVVTEIFVTDLVTVMEREEERREAERDATNKQAENPQKPTIPGIHKEASLRFVSPDPGVDGDPRTPR